MGNENQWSSAAGDSSNVLDGTALGALLGGNGAAAGFSIDHERVPQAIADLEHAADFFEDRAQRAARLAHMPAPGLDEVSVNAVIQIGKWASDAGTNNLEATLIAGAKQLRDLTRRLREELQTYLQIEELNIPQPSSGLSL
jgi:hypothetical protein